MLTAAGAAHLPAPGEEAGAATGDVPQADGDPDDDPEPCPKYASGGKATHQCPPIVATGTRSPCPAGFDRDEYTGFCVSGFVLGTTTNPGGGPGGGPGSSSPGGIPADPEDPEDEEDEEEDDEEEVACTDDQIAIADEYNDPHNWPCTKFTDDVLGDREGTHMYDGLPGHVTGFLTDSYTSGRWKIISGVEALGVTGATITSDWRCPEGNTRVEATGLTHVHGRAGDFTAPGFLEHPSGDGATAEEEAAARKLHGEFVKAVRAAGGRYSAFGQGGTHKDHIHVFW